MPMIRSLDETKSHPFVTFCDWIIDLFQKEQSSELEARSSKLLLPARRRRCWSTHDAQHPSGLADGCSLPFLFHQPNESPKCHSEFGAAAQLTSHEIMSCQMVV